MFLLMALSEGPELSPEVQRCLLVLFNSELSTLEPPTKTAVLFCLLLLSLCVLIGCSGCVHVQTWMRV